MRHHGQRCRRAQAGIEPGIDRRNQIGQSGDAARAGCQAGLQQTQLIFIINSDCALRGIEGSNFKIGARGGDMVA